MEERLNAAENLRARSSRLFSDSSSCDGSRSDNSLNGKWIALILLGLLCAAAGCALFSLSQQFSMGVVLVVCGVACVVLALVFGKGNTRASVLPKDVINDASRIQATKLVSEAAGIDEEVRAFVDMYFGDGRPSRAAIDTLRRNLDELRQIEETINNNYSDSRNLEDQLHRCEIDLREALGGFWADDISIQSAFFRLQTSYSKLLDLEERKREYDKNKGGLETAIRAHSDRIEEYLLKYESKDVSQGSYREMLNRLSVDAASYAQAKKALLDQDKVNTERLKELEELRSQMREFAEAVGSSDLLSYQGIQQIRDERLRISDFESRLKEASSKLSAFINLHPDIVDKQIEGPTEDFAATLKELKKRESQFIEDHDKLLSMINERRANERRLAKSVDLIPQLQDELDDLTAERSDLERRVFVLDSTKEMLAKAKESLSHKYLGPVVQAFD